MIYYNRGQIMNLDLGTVYVVRTLIKPIFRRPLFVYFGLFGTNCYRSEDAFRHQKSFIIYNVEIKNNKNCISILIFLLYLLLILIDFSQY